MNFEEFKQKAGETAERLGGQAVQFAKFVGEKATIAAKLAKLNADILGEKETIRKAHTNIGKRYIELFENAPHEDMLADVEVVQKARQRIDVLKEEIERIKTESSATDADYTIFDEDEFNEESDSEHAETPENSEGSAE